MEIQALKVIGLSSSDADAGEIGDVHIVGGFIAGLDTLCGNVDAGLEYEETNDLVNCSACREIYESIKKSRKRIKFDEVK